MVKGIYLGRKTACDGFRYYTMQCPVCGYKMIDSGATIGIDYNAAGEKIREINPPPYTCKCGEKLDLHQSLDELCPLPEDLQGQECTIYL